MEIAVILRNAALLFAAIFLTHGWGYTTDRSNQNILSTDKNSVMHGGAAYDKSTDTFELLRSTGEPELRMYMDRDTVVMFNYSIRCKDVTSDYVMSVSPKRTKVIIVPKLSKRHSCSNASLEDGNMLKVIRGTVDVIVSSGVIGKEKIEFQLFAENDVNANTTIVQTYNVVVIRKLRPVDTIFRVVVYCVQVFVLTGFGAELDIQVVKQTLRKPVAPAIGFCCQYLVMPLIAFGVAKLVTTDSAVALGIFVAGCCPGGGNSNMYTFLLNGDLSLSITMTTISTVSAMAMLPAWIYSLGVLFIADKSVKIPFSSVAISLAILLVPLAFGVLLRTKFPDMAKKVQKALKPVIVFSAIILITVGVYSNLYIFRLFEPRVVLAACLLPYIGYLIGGVVSAIFRQPWRRIKTIIIETGMQNTSIAYILLTTSFVAPMGDLAAVAPVASAVMTPLPPFLITVCYLLYQKFQKRYDPVTQDGDELQDKSGAKETEQFKDKDKIKEYNVEDELMNKKLTAV